MNYNLRITPGSGNYLYIDDIATRDFLANRWVELSCRESGQFHVNLINGHDSIAMHKTNNISQAFNWAGEWIIEGKKSNA